MEQHRLTLIDVLRLFSRIWPGQLGHVKNFALRIDLRLVSQPVRQNPHRTGPDKREIGT